MLNSINNTTETSSISENSQKQPVTVKVASSQKAEKHEETDETVTIDKPTLEKALAKANELLANTHTERQFVIDEEFGRPIVKIINSETKEVLKQIPSEEAVRLTKSINEMIGLFLDDKI